MCVYGIHRQWPVGGFPEMGTRTELPQQTEGEDRGGIKGRERENETFAIHVYYIPWDSRGRWGLLTLFLWAKLFSFVRLEEGGGWREGQHPGRCLLFKIWNMFWGLWATDRESQRSGVWVSLSVRQTVGSCITYFSRWVWCVLHLCECAFDFHWKKKYILPSSF